jgi:hypothetical protein
MLLVRERSGHSKHPLNGPGIMQLSIPKQLNINTLWAPVPEEELPRDAPVLYYEIFKLKFLLLEEDFNWRMVKRFRAMERSVIKRAAANLKGERARVTKRELWTAEKGQRKVEEAKQQLGKWELRFKVGQELLQEQKDYMSSHHPELISRDTLLKYPRDQGARAWIDWCGKQQQEPKKAAVAAVGGALTSAGEDNSEAAEQQQTLLGDSAASTAAGYNTISI